MVAADACPDFPTGINAALKCPHFLQDPDFFSASAGASFLSKQLGCFDLLGFYA